MQTHSQRVDSTRQPPLALFECFHAPQSRPFFALRPVGDSMHEILLHDLQEKCHAASRHRHCRRAGSGAGLPVRQHDSACSFFHFIDHHRAKRA